MKLEDPILEFHEDTVEDVRKEYGLDKPGAMEAAVDILEDWVKQQKHFLKKDFKRVYLEMAIITTKGSVERAKARLDKVCTMRTLTPHFFGNYDVKEYFKEYYANNFNHAVLPKLTKENYRIYIIKNFGINYKFQTFTDYYRLYIILAEYLMTHDYSKGFIFVGDYTELNIMDYTTKIDLVELRQVMTLMMDGYGVRLKGIHMLTSSKVIEVLISLFMQVLKPKISSRIQVHKTLESLHNSVPKEILPKEYGGKEKSLKELHDNWVDVLSWEENVKHQQEMNAAGTDETLRQRDTFNDQYMGMPGTFRVLSVD